MRLTASGSKQPYRTLTASNLHSGVLIEMDDPTCVEGTRAPNDTVHLHRREHQTCQSEVSIRHTHNTHAHTT